MIRPGMRPRVWLGLAVILLVVGCSDGTTSSSAAAVRTVSAAEAVEILASRTVIDVRTPKEFAAGHIVGALNVPVEASDFDDRIATFDRDEPYFLYCRSGRRSAIAAEIMAKAGFTDIVDAGGLEQLAQAGAPVE